MTNHYPRGSEWRRWDLHLHTPESFENQFRDWENYIQTLSQICGVSVIGITDYFSIDGYKKILEYKSAGRINNFDLILPNIELRLNIFVPRRSSDQQMRRINYHVIFSDELSPRLIEEQFLNALEFEIEGATGSQANKRSLTRTAIEEAGALVKQYQSNFRGDSDYKAGCKNITIDLGQIKRLLDKDCFKGKYVCFLATESWDQIDWGQDYLTRKNLLQNSDGLFCGQSSTVLWALGKADISEKDFIKEFSALKPCIHGSDAHKEDELCRPKENKFCWIKANPTFEGLKQIVYEPEERVYIGSTFPDNKDKSKVISSIAIRNAGEWFEDQRIEINRDLVTIIGGKGSGKTALVDFLGLTGGDYDPKNLSSFLSKAQRELIGTKILLQWEDGSTESELEIARPLSCPEGHKVRYLSQSFVESLCSFDRHSELEKEIENILFQYVPGTQRLGTESFGGLKQKLTEGVQLEISRISSNITEINSKIFELQQLIQSRVQLVNDRDQLDKDITELHKQKPQPSTEEERKTIDESKKLSDQRAKIAADIEKLRIKFTKLELLRKKLGLIVESVERFNLEIESTLTELGENGLVQDVTIGLPIKARQALDQKVNSVTVEIAALEGVEGAAPDNTLLALDLKISELNKKSTFEVQKKNRLQEFNTRIAEHTLKRDALTQKITDIDKNARKELDSKREQRKQFFIAYFQKLEEKRKNLEELYKPLNLKASSTEEGAKVQFYAKFMFNKKKFAINAEGLFDARKCLIRGEQEFAEVGAKYWEELSKMLPATDAKPIDLLIETLQKRDEGTRQVSDQIRGTKTTKDFDDWLYDLNYYDVEYGINYEGTDLDKLSPGKKGVVLLLIYLTIDKDYRPLIVDQPEENLDNRSVYTTLVEYFRKAKKNRQVIIVTHNANLVVNGDAEQVIVANFEKDHATQKTRIRYISGSLENSKAYNATPNILEQQGIREHVCELLEGGTLAFNKREEKYGF